MSSSRWDHRTYVVLKTSAALDSRITRRNGFLDTEDKCRKSPDGALLLLRYETRQVPTMIANLVENHKDGARAAYLTHAQATTLVSGWDNTPETPTR